MTAAANDNSKFARQAWLRALERTASIERHPEVTLPLLVDDWAARSSEAPALVSLDGALSYRSLAERSHRYSRWGLMQGLQSGDVVALLMGNRPEYLAVWLGLTRLGVIVALVNTQLTGAALAHCIRSVNPQRLIVAAELGARIAAIRTLLPADLGCWVTGRESTDEAVLLDAPTLEPVLDTLSAAALTARDCSLPLLDATALYIYTSGTTGLPKAAKVSHYRLMQWSHWFAGLLDLQSSDRLYNCLPLYHSVGGVVATGASLVGGGAVEIRARFSATDFWRDVRATRCTVFQYIGELCRYLVNTPPQPDESTHSLRIACGNGLRTDVWEIFQTRCRIPRILEYYASTESNFSLYNCEGQPGAIGRIPAFLAARLPVALVRFDVDSGEPFRNAAGHCEACGPDEVGEALGRIPPAQQRGGRFEGYADDEASQRKVLREVFAAGDAWYRTGDLMRRDAKGFYYFVDRIGDTYRWKGENVSTAEVLAIILAAPGVLDGVVYGVQVPGTDGRAGMAALVVDAAFALEDFRQHVAQRLPSYARPVFVRRLAALEATGTFKPKKQELMQCGFDLARTSDELYVDDGAGRYLAIDAALHEALAGGRVRL